MGLRNVLLGLLSYSPMTGYQLKALIDQSTNHFWWAHQSQIYRELNHLEEQGLLTSTIDPQEGKPDRRVYRVTKDGRTALTAWLRQFPENLLEPVREEFNVRVFFGAHLEPEILLSQLEHFALQKRHQLAGLQGLTTLIQEKAEEFNAQADSLFWSMSLRRGILETQAALQWAEECAQQLRERGINR